MKRAPILPGAFAHHAAYPLSANNATVEIESDCVRDGLRSNIAFLEWGSIVSEEKSTAAPDPGSADDAPGEGKKSTRSGPTFTESPDPLSGIRKATGDAWKSTEGRTVSMRTYIGSIAAVVILMLLARCGG